MNKLNHELARLEDKYVDAVEDLDVSSLDDGQVDRVGELVNNILADIRTIRRESEKGWDGPYSYDAEEAIRRTAKEIETLAETIEMLNNRR